VDRKEDSGLVISSSNFNKRKKVSTTGSGRKKRDCLRRGEMRVHLSRTIEEEEPGQPSYRRKNFTAHSFLRGGKDGKLEFYEEHLRGRETNTREQNVLTSVRLTYAFTCESSREACAGETGV